MLGVWAFSLAGCSQSKPVGDFSEANTSETPKLDVSNSQSPVVIALAKAEDDKSNRVRIRFTNPHDTETIRLLKPLDGSLYCWLMPHYEFTVKDDLGVDAKLGARCGHFGSPWGGTNWPDDYVIDLGPSESHDETVYLPQAITRNGEYQISFNYVFTPKAGEKTPGGAHPVDLWHGTASSKPIQMILKGQ